MQDLIVLVLVVGAAAYAAWHWLPVAWRNRLGGTHARLAQAPACRSCDSGCGGCSQASPAAAVRANARIIPITPERGPSHSD